MRGPGPGPTLVSHTAEKGLGDPASQRGGWSSLPGPWAAQPASQADVTTPRPSRALRLRLPGEGSRVGRRGQPGWPESCPGRERKGEAGRERESHAVKNPERSQSKAQSEAEEEGARVCRLAQAPRPSLLSPPYRGQLQCGCQAAGSQVRMGCSLSWALGERFAQFRGESGARATWSYCPHLLLVWAPCHLSDKSWDGKGGWE